MSLLADFPLAGIFSPTLLLLPHMVPHQIGRFCLIKVSLLKNDDKLNTVYTLKNYLEEVLKQIVEILRSL